VGVANVGLKIILVDIDRTIFPSLEFAKTARLAALSAMKKEGMGTGIRVAYAVLMQVVREKGPNYQDHLGEMLRRLEENDRARLVAAGVRAYHRAKSEIRPFAEARSALLKMKRAGLRLYVASEGKSVKQWDKLLRMDVHKYFDGAFISEDVGAEKSVKFYSHIVKKLRVRPEEVLMMGDKVERDFVPAKKAGLRAILIDRSAKKKKPEVARNLQEAAELARAMM